MALLLEWGTGNGAFDYSHGLLGRSRNGMVAFFMPLPLLASSMSMAHHDLIICHAVAAGHKSKEKQYAVSPGPDEWTPVLSRRSSRQQVRSRDIGKILGNAKQPRTDAPMRTWAGAVNVFIGCCMLYCIGKILRAGGEEGQAFLLICVIPLQ